MTIDNVSTKTPEVVVKDNRIQQVFTQAAKEMGVNISFEGFYNEDSNARARRMGINTIVFNEKFLDIPQDELQRVGYHEVQHVQNNGEFDRPDTGQTWAFTFTDQFKDLHDRMLEFYKTKLSEGAVFEKKMYENAPKNTDEMAQHSDSYDSWDELLAHLKAYEVFLRQKEAGLETTTQPYEFIEAFRLEDLQLLDRNYRQKIVDDFGEKLEIFRSESKDFSIDDFKDL